jgi:hypothetical protein
MLTGSEAHRRALLDDLQHRIAAARCTARLLRKENLRFEDRELVGQLEGQLADLEVLSRHLVNGY